MKEMSGREDERLVELIHRSEELQWIGGYIFFKRIYTSISYPLGGDSR